jgi:aryl-alcohol dehydrogenase-like predicted oxidoreductase
MERRRLGRTGHESTVAILGAAAFARCTPDEAEVAFTAAIDRGVNHLDIAPSYGAAERNVGPLLPAVRDRVFVACKTHRRDAGGVRAQLEESLSLLGCEQFDLYQLHGVTGLDVLEERVAAAAAILAARDEGLVRFVGITGHDLGAPAAHLEALRRWDLDTVMFPVYPRVWADPIYRADAEALLAHCAEHDVGAMAIKAVARRPWGDAQPSATSWYEPWTAPDDVAAGVRFALSTPGIAAFCTPGDLAVLTTALDAAEGVAPLTQDERASAMADMAGEEVIFPLQEKARQ